MMNGLIVKSLLGVMFLVAVLAAALFVSAGTTRFRAAWIYLGVYGLCSLLITFYLIRFDQKLLAARVQAGPTAETRKVQRLLQGIGSLFFLCIFVVAGLDRRFGWSQVPPAVSAVAEVLVALGFGIVLLVFRANSYTSMLIEVQSEQKVIETGPYRFVRHPMYSGADLLLLATPPALSSWVALAPAVALIAVIVARLLDEEKFLRADLSGYAEYCRKVRYRLVPLLW